MKLLTNIRDFAVVVNIIRKTAFRPASYVTRIILGSKFRQLWFINININRDVTVAIAENLRKQINFLLILVKQILSKNCLM